MSSNHGHELAHTSQHNEQIPTIIKRSRSSDHFICEWNTKIKPQITLHRDSRWPSTNELFVHWTSTKYTKKLKTSTYNWKHVLPTKWDAWYFIPECIPSYLSNHSVPQRIHSARITEYRINKTGNGNLLLPQETKWGKKNCVFALALDSIGRQVNNSESKFHSKALLWGL